MRILLVNDQNIQFWSWLIRVTRDACTEYQYWEILTDPVMKYKIRLLARWNCLFVLLLHPVCLGIPFGIVRINVQWVRVSRPTNDSHKQRWRYSLQVQVWCINMLTVSQMVSKSLTWWNVIPFSTSGVFTKIQDLLLYQTHQNEEKQYISCQKGLK